MEGHLGSRPGLPGGEDSYDATFTSLYQRYYTRVFAFVYSRVGNVDLTKDLTAEIFERAYVKGHSLREPEAYATWLFMIAKNVVVGYYRKQKREANGMNRLKESLPLIQSPLDPEDQAINNERLRQLLETLRTLSQRDQELLSLKFDAALSYAEIARITGMSEVNVRVSIFRALKRLRERVRRAAPHP
jgi:RNA polymerase sigma-70 factor (ECF subfamily)